MMERAINKTSLFKHSILLILTLINYCCSAQVEEKKFLNKVNDQRFKKILNNLEQLKDYRFTDLNFPAVDAIGYKFNENESKSYLDFQKDSLYDRVEYYNHDEDIRTYGETKEILPYSWIKAFLSENLVSLFVAKSNGVNDGDLDMYYLFILDYEGKLVDHIILSKQMITYDGIRPNHFGFLDKNHFNRYIYDTREIHNGKKVTFDNFCIIEKYEIDDNGKINLLETIQQDLNDDPNLNYGRYLNLKEIPSDDPMSIFIE